MSEQFTVATLQHYHPLDALNPKNLQQILSQLKLEILPAGSTLFNKGDLDNRHYFLVKGDIDLVGDSGVFKTIKSGASDSFNSIGHIQPRSVTAKANTEVIIFKLDTDLVDVMLTWDQTNAYQVTELDADAGNETADDDWMSRILQTEAFHRIPPANIQAIFMRMEEVPVKAGDKIINQSEDGDYFYIIKQGRCLVTRALPNQPKAVKLAELKDGDSFGEEALIANSKRNATVTMLSEGVLNRLAKTDFLELLNEPMLNWVNFEQAQQLIEGGAEWLDVRLPAEHQADAIKTAQHIPLIFLRMKVDTLDSDKAYILYCDTGRRSSAASFLLNERGFTTYILEKGIASVPEEFRTSEV